MKFHPLKVVELKKPIDDATTIQFEINESLYSSFSFYPGQHLIIKFIVEGKEVRRSYSLNSCPYIDEPLEVTVKKVKDGLVSNYVNSQLKVGDVLDVMVPQGRFYANMHKDNYKTYYLFAAGSGVTPIFSILKSALYEELNSVVHFFYGNKDQNSILFKEELDNLQQEFSERLNVIHTLSHSKSSWTTWKPWKGRKGRIDPKDVEWFIEAFPPIAQTTEYYVCGPGAMNVSVRDTLTGLGIPNDLVHIEQFGGDIATNKDLVGYNNAKLTVLLSGEKVTTNIPSGKTILQVLKEEKIEPPYSCESGVCGTCIAKVKKGEVKMKACMALEDKEISQGYILTCQGIPISEEVEIEY